MNPLKFAALIPVLSLAVAAQEPASTPETTPQQPAAAAPAPVERVTPRLARLTYLDGPVQIQRADNTGDDTAVLNMPLAEGTRLITADYGEAEIEFEDGSVVRVTPRSVLSLDTLNLDAKSVARTRVSLLSGTAYFELRKAPGLAFTVDAGGIESSPLENLTLRLNFDDAHPVFAVLSGSARLVYAAARPAGQETDAPAAGFTTTLRSGETLSLDPSDPDRYHIESNVVAGTWDQWNQARDQAAAEQADARTAARDSFAGAQGYGWSDLDANGKWYSVPGQQSGGDVTVWQPSAAAVDDPADFDPYGNGAWVWNGQGYAFASAYPWGWTPFHCGAWAFYPGFGWAWAPDPSCGAWGFAGYGGGETLIYVAGGGPPRILPVPSPVKGPGRGPHPIIPVHNPVGIHPPHPRPVDAPVRIAGQVATPLPPLGTAAAEREPAPASALALDYPVDAKTHQPMLGTPAGSVAARAAAAPSSAAPGTQTHHQRAIDAPPSQRSAPPAARPQTSTPAPAPAATHSAPPPPPPPAPAPAHPSAPAPESKPKS